MPKLHKALLSKPAIIPVALCTVIAIVVLKPNTTDTSITDNYVTDIKHFPTVLVAAVVAMEDPDFFETHRITSPITAQLSGITIPRDKSRPRFVTVFTWTVSLALTLDHNEIIAASLDAAYYGRGCRGADDAALVIFNQPLAGLSSANLVALAALTRSPSSYHQNHTAWTERIGVTARQMVKDGTLTQPEADEIIQMPLPPENGQRCPM